MKTVDIFFPSENYISNITTDKMCKGHPKEVVALKHFLSQSFRNYFMLNGERNLPQSSFCHDITTHGLDRFDVAR